MSLYGRCAGSAPLACPPALESKGACLSRCSCGAPPTKWRLSTCLPSACRWTRSFFVRVIAVRNTLHIGRAACDLPEAWHKALPDLECILEIAGQLSLQGAIFEGSTEDHQARVDHTDEENPPRGK